MAQKTLISCDSCGKESDMLPGGWLEFRYSYDGEGGRTHAVYHACSATCFAKKLDDCITWSAQHTNVTIANMPIAFARKIAAALATPKPLVERAQASPPTMLNGHGAAPRTVAATPRQSDVSPPPQRITGEDWRKRKRNIRTPEVLNEKQREVLEWLRDKPSVLLSTMGERFWSGLHPFRQASMYAGMLRSRGLITEGRCGTVGTLTETAIQLLNQTGPEGQHQIA